MKRKEKRLNEHLFHSNKRKKETERKLRPHQPPDISHYPDENKPHRILFIQSNGWIIGFSSLRLILTSSTCPSMISRHNQRINKDSRILRLNSIRYGDDDHHHHLLFI